MYNNIYATLFTKQNPPSTKLKQFFIEQDQWTRSQIAGQNLTDYWRQVSLIVAQFDGCFQGYKEHHLPGKDLSKLELQMMNGAGDMLDLTVFLQNGTTDLEKMESEERERFLTRGHCSALAKVTADFGELFTG